MRSDAAAGDRHVRLRLLEPFDDEGSTLREIADGLDVDEETAMMALLDAACHGWIETDLHRWRPVGGEDKS
jgi:hypothetical protein